MNYDVKEIVGETKVEKIILVERGIAKIKEIALDGVFIEVGRIAHTDLVEDLVERDSSNQLIVDEKGQTKTEGIFAAGDVTQVEFKQITIAEGQGTIAALTAYQYLQRKAGNQVGKIMDRSHK
jgi:alkyl hydroperoxide reductase subunit AhpF